METHSSTKLAKTFAGAKILFFAQIISLVVLFPAQGDAELVVLVSPYGAVGFRTGAPGIISSHAGHGSVYAELNIIPYGDIVDMAPDTAAVCAVRVKVLDTASKGVELEGLVAGDANRTDLKPLDTGMVAGFLRSHIGIAFRLGSGTTLSRISAAVRRRIIATVSRPTPWASILPLPSRNAIPM